MLTFASALINRRHRRLTAVMAFGIPFQGVIGGITVLTQLNPYVVALHLLLSLVLIALSVWLVRLTRDLRPLPASGLGLVAARVAFVAMWLAVWLGTVVTGSGPHAGDDQAPRNGLNGGLVTQPARVRGVRQRSAPPWSPWSCCDRRAALLLVGGGDRPGRASASPSTDSACPSAWSSLHLLGACLAIAAATNLHLSVVSARRRSLRGGRGPTVPHSSDQTLRSDETRSPDAPSPSVR